ncbi:MAG: HAD family phosphatase [Corynebacteriales bacterium]|nr:HAD family phosphatase [Mycobacteriales bacterium]
MALNTLIVDWGGVLTDSIGRSWSEIAQRTGIDVSAFRRVMDASVSENDEQNWVHQYERGELTDVEFEKLLLTELRAELGHAVPEGFLATLWQELAAAPDMVDVVRRARKQGLHTALLSNSWGECYDRTEWDELFDHVVISGEVGLRKPDPAIFTLTTGRLGVSPNQCVFVDDLAINVRAAANVGMVGIHHQDTATTAQELETLFGLQLVLR